MSEEKQPQALAPVDPPKVPPNDPRAVAAAFGEDGGEFVCSFNLTTAEGRQLLQKCEEEPDTPAREMANRKFKLRHLYAKKIDYTHPETGEVYPIMRVCLVTTEGKVHACCSDGVRKSLWRLMAGHGMPPWKEGIPVEIKLKGIGKGRQLLTVLEDFDTPDTKGKR